MSKLIHVSMSVAGFLNEDDDYMTNCLETITKTNGVPFRDIRELRDAFAGMLAKGVLFIPLGPTCDGFDPKVGCPGHEGEVIENDL